MVITYNNNGEIVNSLKDCLELIETELAEAILYFNKNGDNAKLVEEHEALKQEFRGYEMSNESYYSCLNEVLEVIEGLKDEVKESKRLSRDSIVKTLSSIINTINNEI
ncbi:hypothetical protein [Clostridium sp.]|uniref:hypothetical protein n=1 Tax=Clostridium sp. TaxID=1506 RepID=UPI002623AA83|nr:hypothetical protein [Clostridium sp.]